MGKRWAAVGGSAPVVLPLTGPPASPWPSRPPSPWASSSPPSHGQSWPPPAAAAPAASPPPPAHASSSPHPCTRKEHFIDTISVGDPDTSGIQFISGGDHWSVQTIFIQIQERIIRIRLKDLLTRIRILRYFKYKKILFDYRYLSLIFCWTFPIKTNGLNQNRQINSYPAIFFQIRSDSDYQHWLLFQTGFRNSLDLDSETNPYSDLKLDPDLYERIRIQNSYKNTTLPFVVHYWIVKRMGTGRQCCGAGRSRYFLVGAGVKVRLRLHLW